MNLERAIAILHKSAFDESAVFRVLPFKVVEDCR